MSAEGTVGYSHGRKSVVSVQIETRSPGGTAVVKTYPLSSLRDSPHRRLTRDPGLASGPKAYRRFATTK